MKVHCSMWPGIFGHTLILGCFLSVVAVPAAAQITNPTPQRSYVSRLGSDSNNCGPAAPCRTFQGALAQTIAGGEVLVLDSAGYGLEGNGALLTITQPVTITVPPGVYAGISPPAGFDGVIINVPANGTVTIRGLTINGFGGTSGIDVQNGSVLVLEDSTIENLVNGVVAVDGFVNITDSRIRDMTGIGVSVTTSSSATNGLARILSTAFRSIVGAGFYASDGVGFALRDSWFGGCGVQISVSGVNPSKGEITGNFFNSGTVLVQSTTAGVNAVVEVRRNNFFKGPAAIEATGPASVVYVSGNDIFSTPIGISQAAGAIVYTHQDNHIDASPTPVSGVLTPDTSVY